MSTSQVSDEKPGEKEHDDQGEGLVDDEILSNRYNSDDADMTMVSSDGVNFKVHSHRLRNVSSVLGSMFSLAQNDIQRNPIVLTAPVIEHSIVIRHLLDIIHDLEVESFKEGDTCQYAIDLIDKWDKPDARKLSDCSLRARFYKKEERTFNSFLIAVKLKDWKLASEIIGHFDARWTGEFVESTSSLEEVTGKNIGKPLPAYYDNPSEYLDGVGKYSENVFNLVLCTYRDFLRLQPTVAWALLRAIGDAQRNTFDRGCVGGKFYKRIMEAYPETGKALGVNDYEDISQGAEE